MSYKNDMAQMLIKDALKHIERGEAEGAAWRLADAMGYLREITDEAGRTSVCGLHYATGLGNQHLRND